MTQLPPGLAGLILGGVFAAAISSLDSILAALSQTTVSLLHRGHYDGDAQAHRYLLRQSRIWVVVWGLVLTGFTLLMRLAKEEAGIPIVPLAFGMTSYTMGPLLAMFLCALQGRGSYRGLLIGSIISFVAVVFIRTDVWVLLNAAGLSYEWIATLPTYTAKLSPILDTSGAQIGEEITGINSVIGYFWAWPLTAAVTYLFGMLIPAGKAPNV